MGKRKRSAQDDSVKFVGVRGREFKQFEADLLEESPDDVLARAKGFAQAATSKVVKVRVTYRKGDEVSANNVAIVLAAAVKETGKLAVLDQTR